MNHKEPNSEILVDESKVELENTLQFPENRDRDGLSSCSIQSLPSDDETQALVLLPVIRKVHEETQGNFSVMRNTQDKSDLSKRIQLPPLADENSQLRQFTENEPITSKESPNVKRAKSDLKFPDIQIKTLDKWRLVLHKNITDVLDPDWDLMNKIKARAVAPKRKRRRTKRNEIENIKEMLDES